MKQKLLNKLWLRVGMIVAIMTTALSGTAWAETYTMSMDSGTKNGTKDVHWTANNATLTHSNVSWSASFSGGSITNSNNYVQIGSKNSPFTTITLSTSGISGTITEVKVGCGAYNSNATVAVTVGGNAFGGNAQSVGAAPSTSGPCAQNTFSGSASGAIVITITNGNSGRAGYIDYVSVTYTSGGSSSTPSLSVNPTSIAFGEKTINGSYQETFDVTFANLTENLTVSGFSGVTVSPTTISKDATSPATVTVTYAPTAEGNISGNVTVSNTADAMSQTVAVTGSAYDPSNLTYYEKVTSAPSDWTGDYIFTGINSGNYYALTGVSNNLGTTAQVTVTEDGIASTSTTDAYKVTVAETTNGYSLYMDGVGYLSYSGSNNQLHASDEFEESTCEWTISFASGVATITNVAVAGRMLQFNYNNGNPRFACYTSSQVKLTLFKLNDGTPSISADDVSITYDAEDGEIAYTISNPVSGGSLVASETASWLEVDDVAQVTTTGTIEFICDTNPTGTQRTAEVTLTYTYNTNETLTKTVVITQAGNPDALVTIAEARAQGTGNVHTKGIVTSSVGTTAYIQDANAAICVYGESLTVGDEIEVSGTLTDFHGLLEITEPIVTVLSQENAVTPEVLTIAQVKASTKQGWLVKIENATVTEVGSSNNYTIAQGDETITLHGALGEVAVNDVITFTGNIGCYNSVQLVNPTDVTVTGTVTPTTYTLSWTAGEHTELFVFDAADETTPLTSGDEIAAGTTINVSIDVDEGYQLDALTVKDASDNDVSLTEITAGSYYSFTMPEGDVTIAATAVAVTPPTPASGKYVKVTSTNDLTDGQYLIVYEDGAVAFDGSLETLDVASNTIDVIITNDEITATNETVAAEFTIDVTEGTIKSASGFYIGRNTDTNGMLTNATTTYANTFSIDDDGNADIVSSGGAYLRYNSDSGQTRFRYFKSSTYTGQKAIQLYKKVESVTVTSAGYATFASDNALDFTNSSIKAYIATADGTTGVTFTKIDKVPAGTGVLLYKDGGATENIPVFDGTGAEDTSDNVFVPGTGAAVASEGTGVKNYILSNGSEGVGFYPASGKTVAVGKAYISVSTETNVKGFIMLPDSDDPTAIEMVNGQSSMVNEIYNLAGQRINKLQKGINIVNGKKILY